MLDLHASVQIISIRTDEVVEAQERPRELMVVLHDDPYPRANTPIDQL